MYTNAFTATFIRKLTAVAVLALAATGCSINETGAPALTGPSEYALSLTLTASPDILPRDGASRSVITVSARDPENKPVNGQRMVLSATDGGLSVGEVVTNSNGVATFEYIAPGANVGVNSAQVGATPVGTNFDNSRTQVVRIGLVGPGIPVPSFTVNPASPKRFEVATFNASATTLNGGVCNGACTYTWQVGSATFSGQIATYAFSTEGVYSVTLTVTSAGGVSASTMQTVTVTAATAPTVDFVFSPTNAKVGDTVFFSATATAAGGASISSYHWEFGDGNTFTGTTSTASNPYAAARVYTVRLTVTDSNGLSATTTKTVTVVVP
jgi:PKD repeat protein